MLIIQPSGGLCNRMRVINSAKILARKRNEKLIILWLNSPELNCPFESLFRPLPSINIINMNSKWNIKKYFYLFSARQRYYNDDILNHKTDGNLNPDFFEQLKDPVYIFTWEHFYSSENYELFIPTDELQTKILAITKKFGQHSIGVHIRRTDNGPSITKSSTMQFIKLMEQELQQNPQTSFYLATDDMAEEKKLRLRFKDRIISNTKKVLDRNSKAGIQDALVDLYCLSETKKIIGSYWSSFTDIAAAIHKIPKIIAGNED